jgi:hypothetical protein
LGAAPAYSWLKAHLRGRAANAAWFAVGALLFAFAAMKALSGAYSPFLYFRF